MAVNRFVLNGISYHGKGAIQEIPGLVAAKGFKKAFIASDPDLVKFGITKKVTDLLDQNGMAYEVYDHIKPNPTIENVTEGVEAYKKSGADYMIAIGGGSSMDTGKAIGIIINNPEFADVRSLEGVAPTKKRTVYTIAVPTTAGTGSETTIAAVITDAQTRDKYAISDFPLIPDYAVLDPEMTRSLPPRLTASTGMDALTHAVEAFIGRSTTRDTREDALSAVELIFSHLERAYRDGGDLEARRAMLTASFRAGCAFTKSYVGYVHAIAHSLGGEYNIPHGLANAVLLPFVLEAYGEHIHKKLYHLALAAGLVEKGASYEEAARIFIDAVKDMKKRFLIGDTIKEIKEEDIPKLAHYADKEANPLYPVPVLMDSGELEQFYYAVSEQ